jgi:hypothetical protein
MSGVSYGLVVDAHLVLEHIHTVVTENDSIIQKLQGLHKLKIENLTQAVALGSFENRIPKYFSKSSAIASSALKRTSHFDQIPSFKEWNAPTHGFRDRLKDELNAFDRTHTRVIEDTLLADSKAYSVAKFSLNESITWIGQLINYMDETYNDLIRHNTFADDKAWQLTTQLVRRIFLEVSSPLTGIINLFKVGHNEEIGQLIFWPMLRAHDIMKRYKDASFKDDASIASEYVKFLAANTGNEAADKMITRFSAIETDVKNVAKSVASVEKSNGQSLNRSDWQSWKAEANTEIRSTLHILRRFVMPQCWTMTVYFRCPQQITRVYANPERSR